MANSMGAYAQRGLNQMGAYEAPGSLSNPPPPPLPNDLSYRRRREQYVRRQVAKALGLKELWVGRRFDTPS